MTNHPPEGSFHLRHEVRLVDTSDGGVVLQENPLRVLKINRAAFDLLRKCEQGLRLDSVIKGHDEKGVLSFFDLMRQSRILDWMPPRDVDPPFVSIIIPVYNRAEELSQCLSSLKSMDYPGDRLEIIVVDDASQDQTAAVARRFGARLFIQPHNQGQSAARNVGASAAQGEIVAFIDSDCIADSQWIKELVPFFQDPRIALVGGYVGAYYREKPLDRYEAVCSALNMGSEQVLGQGSQSVFYVPTCNMLIRKDEYTKIGGLDEKLRVGEDVDLCWRLMAEGHHLVYVPKGMVKHKHRNRFLSAHVRRFDYGTSEAVLYARFPQIAKKFPWQPGGVSVIVAVLATLATASVYGLLVISIVLAAETGVKYYQLEQKMAVRLGLCEIFKAIVKSHFKLAYYLAYYTVRYYLLGLLALSLCVPSLIPLLLPVALFPALVEYIQKKPRLNYPVFTFFYWAEHAFYQSGAFWGCLKQRSFRLYRIVFAQVGFLPRSSKKKGQRPPVAKQRHGSEAAI